MQFSSEANNQDLVSDARDRVDATSTDYPINALTREINKAYHRVASWIQDSDGTWQYDDTNNTTLPIGTTDLVSGQQDYSLDDTMLEVERIEIKDSDGNWVKLKAIDQSQIGQALDEFQETDGDPIYYDKVGRSLFLYPAPNYASTGGLKVHFQRHANIFAVTDDTKEPGFADVFHGVLSAAAALWYANKYKKDEVPALVDEIRGYERDIKKFYSRRNKDIKKALRGVTVDAV